MRWHLPHEQALRVPLFISLDYFVFQAQKLKDLLEHIWCNWAFNTQRFWHLWCCLLCVNFDRLHTFSELVKLPKNLLSFWFELCLKHFQSLLIIEFLPNHDTRFVTKQIFNLMEEIFCRPAAVFEIHLDTWLWKVTETQNVILLDLLCNDSCKNGLIVWDEVVVCRLLLASSLHCSLFFEFI